MKTKINFTILDYVTLMLMGSALCYQFLLKYSLNPLGASANKRVLAHALGYWLGYLSFWVVKWVSIGISVLCRDVIKRIPNLQIQTSTQKEENNVWFKIVFKIIINHKYLLSFNKRFIFTVGYEQYSQTSIILAHVLQKYETKTKTYPI